MATELGEVTTYKRLYLQFRDSVGKTTNITLNFCGTRCSY